MTHNGQVVTESLIGEGSGDRVEGCRARLIAWLLEFRIDNMPGVPRPLRHNHATDAKPARPAGLFAQCRTKFKVSAQAVTVEHGRWRRRAGEWWAVVTAATAASWAPVR
jgi:hypothetical protein